jgi:hypothetical protein
MKDLAGCVEGFYKHENVMTGRLFLKYLGLHNKGKERDGIIAYSYIRWLDDMVDSGINPASTRIILEQEKKVLQEMGQYISETESYPYLSHLYGQYGQRIMDLFASLIHGLMIDNELIMTGNPLNEEDLRTRNLYHTIPCFQTLSIIAHGQELESSERFSDLMIAWSTYDSLRDLKEDLGAGLLLFSKEELSLCDVEFHRGEPVPERFKAVYHTAKHRTISNLSNLASSADETNLPVLDKIALRGYYLTRAAKLAASSYPLTNPVVFGAPR